MNRKHLFAGLLATLGITSTIGWFVRLGGSVTAAAFVLVGALTLPFRLVSSLIAARGSGVTFLGWVYLEREDWRMRRELARRQFVECTPRRETTFGGVSSTTDDLVDLLQLDLFARLPLTRSMLSAAANGMLSLGTDADKSMQLPVLMERALERIRIERQLRTGTVDEAAALIGDLPPKSAYLSGAVLDGIIGGTEG